MTQGRPPINGISNNIESEPDITEINTKYENVISLYGLFSQ